MKELETETGGKLKQGEVREGDMEGGGEKPAEVRSAGEEKGIKSVKALCKGGKESQGEGSSARFRLPPSGWKERGSDFQRQSWREKWRLEGKKEKRISVWRNPISVKTRRLGRRGSKKKDL